MNPSTLSALSDICIITRSEGEVLTFKTRGMGIHLREKKIGNGQVSLYLDIYHNKKRWYEFLDIHISKSKLSEQDKEKKLYAQQIKIKRENELIVEDNGLINRGKHKTDFFTWFEQYGKAKPCY